MFNCHSIFNESLYLYKNNSKDHSTFIYNINVNAAKYVEAFFAEHSWNYTVRKRRHDIRHDSHIQRTLYDFLPVTRHDCTGEHWLTTWSAARDQAGAGRKHCQREIRGGTCVEARHREREPAREYEKAAVIEVVVGRVEARAGLRRAKCGCCNYNV